MTTLTRAAVAEALFVSDLQPSQAPSTRMISAEVRRVVRRYGVDGCAARMAAEFGDHPDLAVRRMGWVREVLAAAG
jgi:hypothetical protein